MALLSSEGFVQDTWLSLADGEAAPASGDIVVSWEWLARDWELLVKHDGRLGVVFPNNARVEELRLFLPRLALIVLNFPAFNDGRSYSIARQLRQDGFRGEIRARGDVLPDQLQFMLQVGFDALEVGERFDPEFWRHYLKRMSLTYQHDLADGKTPQGAQSVWKARQSPKPPPSSDRTATG